MRTLLRRLGYLLRRQIDADLAEELEMHRAMVQERLERSGMAPDAAASASARRLGNVTLAREDARAVLVWPWLESIGQDLRIGMRSLLQRPAFTAVAVMTLAVGIGANTAVFSLLDASIFRRLHASYPEELVFPFEHAAKGRGENRFYLRDIRTPSRREHVPRRSRGLRHQPLQHCVGDIMLPMFLQRQLGAARPHDLQPDWTVENWNDSRPGSAGSDVNQKTGACRGWRG